MRTSPICYIAGALPLPPNFACSPSADDFIIAADRGHEQLERSGLTPHMIVGDFDSSPRPTHHHNITVLPIEKDDTDMGYAIKVGLAKQYRNFVLLGGLGDLLDHTMANLQHLYALSLQNCRAVLIGDRQCATVLTNGSLTLTGDAGTRCSVFALGGDARGVTLHNLYYSIEHTDLSPAFPLGVSNSFTPDPAHITVQQGSLLIIWEWSETDSILNFFT